MLQIVTKMYFREGVPLYSTTHREVLYTNCSFLRADFVELPVGSLAPSSPLSPVSTVTASVIEHLEAEGVDGQRAMLVATGGRELIDDLGLVLSFGLNAAFSRNRDLVRRLVPDAIGTDRQTQASNLFGRTFEAARFVSDAELEQLRVFMNQLLGLRRPHYEAAMRAIRRIVGATQRAADDPTLAYVDIVAALESLSVDVEGVAITWDRMDSRKRSLIDKELDSVDGKTADRIRAAVVEAERLGVKARFVAFVMNNVSSEFHRLEAVGLTNAVQAADLERLVKQAYDIRSLSVHALRDLRPEAWLLGSQSEAVLPPDGNRMLSHRGLARLAWHVVKKYVATAPVGVDPDFVWRSYLPGQLLMPLAPQYWIGNPAGFSHQVVGQRFSGFLQLVVETLAGRSAMPDMRAVLEQIESLVPGTQKNPEKSEMIAIYVLWHYITAPDLHRPDADRFLASFEPELHEPGMAAFVTGLLLRGLPEWTADQWQSLATARRTDRSLKHHLALPATLDAALQVLAATQLAAIGRTDAARQHASYAVEELPGNQSLMAWETSFTENGQANIDVWDLAVQPVHTAGTTESETVTKQDSADDEVSDD